MRVPRNPQTRNIKIQPNGSVTCGQHACGMVLNTQGNPVAVDTLINQMPGVDKGTYVPDLVSLLSQNNVKSIGINDGLAKVSDLKQWTSSGVPSIAMVQTGPSTYHHLVVDGITKRNGVDVVAIRDPAGIKSGVYYETLESFSQRFTGNVVRVIK